MFLYFFTFMKYKIIVNSIIASSKNAKYLGNKPHEENIIRSELAKIYLKFFGILFIESLPCDKFKELHITVIIIKSDKTAIPEINNTSIIFFITSMFILLYLH